MKEFLLYEGSTYAVEWYVDERGRMKAKEYYMGLSEDEKNGLRWIVRHMAGQPHWNPITENALQLGRFRTQNLRF